MKNKVLMLATTASMIQQFNMDNIKLLQELGYKVEVACNFYIGNTCSEEKINELKRDLSDIGVEYYQIDFVRNPIHVWKIYQAYSQVKHLCKTHGYTFIHCHTPVGSVVARMVGHRCKIPVMYTAHGFHFFKGAPIKNWLLYYPIEKFFSHWTEVLVTITEEDYIRAKEKFAAKKIEHIHGVGINLDYYASTGKDREEIRKKYREQMDVKPNEYIILSVGELNDNKNHEMVITALHELNNKNLKYVVCGIGEKKDYYESLIKKWNMTDQVFFLGYRDDLRELYIAADLFIFPSKREGLSVALMEAIAANTPVIASDIRGNNELILDGGCRFPATDKAMLKQMIANWVDDSLEINTSENYQNLKRYSKKNVHEEMKRIYRGI